MKKSILIVEDELRIRFLLRDYLTKDDFNVFEASMVRKDYLFLVHKK